MKLLLAVSVTFLTFQVNLAHAAIDYSVCPKVDTLPAGVYDPSPTLSDAMDQFRDHLEAADEVVTAGSAGNSVSNADLSAAADHVESARNCALLIVRNGKTTMKPDKAAELPASQQGAFLDQFVQAMTQFSQLLGQYEAAFTRLLAEPANARNFSNASDLQMQVRDFEDQGHSHF